MRILTAIEAFEVATDPIALTLGYFDGVHLGHQAIFKQLKEVGATSVVLTFSNHPATVLRPGVTPPLLSTNEQRLRWIEEAGIDTTVMLRFTQEFSQQETDEFLSKLHRQIPFDHLILGHDAHLGKGRGGTPEVLAKLAQEEGFSLEYLPPVDIDGTPISSSRIRAAVQEGNLSEAAKLLGRPYSLESTVIRGPGRGREIGFPTANLPVAGYCLPPFGVYACTVMGKQGVANLGYAPTLHEGRVPLLEVHILDFDGDLYEKTLEVSLGPFLRPEKKFCSVDALKNQITQDVEAAKRR